MRSRHRATGDDGDPVELVEVELLAPVLFDGVIEPAGTRRDVAPAVADSLEERGYGRRIAPDPAPPAPEPAPEPEPKAEPERATEPPQQRRKRR